MKRMPAMAAGPALTIYNQHLSVLTDEAVGFTDVTEQLVAAVERSGVKFRLPNLQTKHTTTGLMSAHLTTRLRSKAG